MSTKVVGSNEPDSVAKQIAPSSRLYGQNGFGGPSSDTPGNRTVSGFLPDPGTPLNSQLRKGVSTTPLPTTVGMKKRT